MTRNALLTIAALGFLGVAAGGCPRHHIVHHGARKHAVAHRWVYYPKARVYHSTNTGVYWHREGAGRWVRTTVRPRRVRLGRAVVTKWTKTEPWRNHHVHVKLKVH